MVTPRALDQATSAGGVRRVQRSAQRGPGRGEPHLGHAHGAAERFEVGEGTQHRRGGTIGGIVSHYAADATGTGRREALLQRARGAEGTDDQDVVGGRVSDRESPEGELRRTTTGGANVAWAPGASTRLGP